jgi:hypothetical protein
VKSLPDAHPLPHQDEASPCLGSDTDEEEPSDDGTRDQSSNYGKIHNRYQQMIDRRATDFGFGSNSNGHNSESQNKISDAALEFQNWYSDTASKYQDQCLVAASENKVSIDGGEASYEEPLICNTDPILVSNDDIESEASTSVILAAVKDATKDVLSESGQESEHQIPITVSTEQRAVPAMGSIAGLPSRQGNDGYNAPLIARYNSFLTVVHTLAGRMINSAINWPELDSKFMSDFRQALFKRGARPGACRPNVDHNGHLEIYSLLFSDPELDFYLSRSSLFTSCFKKPVTDLFTGADNPDGEKTELEECLLQGIEPLRDSIRKPIIIIGFYHKYVRMKYLSHAACLLFPSTPFPQLSTKPLIFRRVILLDSWSETMKRPWKEGRLRWRDKGRQG